MLFFKLYLATYLAGVIAAPVQSEESLAKRESDSPEYNSISYVISKEKREEDGADGATYYPRLYLIGPEGEKRKAFPEEEKPSYAELGYGLSKEEDSE
ncbi:uncharacterized protein F4807DRAFT_459015 [Annulohypoxylon truncatum]|uniref:uncharacterized protein n=1 Tax=Annulohypoxylon truncatum TaxID=327061 RepID=UPI0020082F06|nr:uncharacterized protein F4807DRAFT_459015 [Annulohypoxylon truncatum]KAI1211436.1 hypothetical protein F4807DRAFT_459015 [Annulohypoxylon truncatum]